MTKAYSRRSILQQIGVAGFAAATGTTGAVSHAFAQSDSRPWSFITDTEARWLAAACDVFIPEDDDPSASQAGVVDYIDFQLATDYGNGHGLYLEGPFPQGTPQQGYQLPLTPAELIRAGIAGHLDAGPALFDLAPDARAEAIQGLSENTGNLGEVPASTFFTELLSLTNEGYFADPIYLGNANYAGWKMVGFPGAHAYYLEAVDDFNRPYDKPPMGIAHDDNAGATSPRIIPQES